MHFARDVADRILFMDGGVVVEEGPARQLIDLPRRSAPSSFWRTTLNKIGYGPPRSGGLFCACGARSGFSSYNLSVSSQAPRQGRVAAPSVCFAVACILLAAAPTATPCFRRWRRSSPLPLVGEPLAKRESFPVCQGLPSLGATTTTSASGGNRKSLLGPRPARRKQSAADAGCRNPGSGTP